MMYELNIQDQTARLSGELTIYTAGEIKQRFAELPAGGTLDVDLSGVSEIDSAGLQLMLLLKKKPDAEIRFVHHSAPVVRLVDLANLAGALGDPMILSASAGKE